MTPRPLTRTCRAAAAGCLLAFGLLSLAGCDPRTLVYFLQPFEPTIKPKGPDLTGKRVVVLTHATSGALSDFQAIDQEIATGLIKVLREKVKKIDIVDPAKVRTWASTGLWTDPAEAAKKFEADVVVFLEVDNFQVQSPSSPDMFQGNSRVHVQAIELAYPKDSKKRPMKDKKKESEVVFDDIKETLFPNKGPVPTGSGVSKPGFKKKFLDLVVAEVSWCFVEHTQGDDIQDTNFGK